MSYYTVIDSPDDFPRIKWWEWVIMGLIVVGCVAFMVFA